MTFHAYNGPRPPEWSRPEGWDPQYDFKGGIAGMRDVMERNGDGKAEV